jgi:Ca-activated chloride channel family protein
MTGEPLEAAKEAALRLARYLGPDDRLSVVAFDHEVLTLYGPAPGGDPMAEDAIRRLYEGGTTNLSGGWLKGREHVAAGLVEGTNRVVLLTDGCANEGIVSATKLTGLARSALKERLSTTCIGFGGHFNEDLLRAMADAGGGNYWYVEEVEQMAGIFDEEIEGLVSLAAQNLEVKVRLTHPRVAGVSFLQSYEMRRVDDVTCAVTLGDLAATSPRALGLLFHVEHVEQLGQTALGEVEVSADVVTADGVEHRVVTMPVVANLDETDHVVPAVDTTLVRFMSAKAREEAVHLADAGDYRGAAAAIRAIYGQLSPHAADAEIAEEMEDLSVEADRLEERKWEARDRKYHLARGRGLREMKQQYIQKISRQAAGAAKRRGRKKKSDKKTPKPPSA